MAIESKPKTRPVWSETGNVSEPSDAKKSLGWVQEVPPHEIFNWVLGNLSQFAAHINESGIPIWDATTVYEIDSYAKGSDGELYRSTSAGNAANDPSTVPGKNFWDNVIIEKFTKQSSIEDSGFTPYDLNDLTLMINNSAGDFYLSQGTFTLAQITVIRDNILALWITEVETP